jgi:hypothetical protein
VLQVVPLAHFSVAYNEPKNRSAEFTVPVKLIVANPEHCPTRREEVKSPIRTKGNTLAGCCTNASQESRLFDVEEENSVRLVRLEMGLSHNSSECQENFHQMAGNHCWLLFSRG